MCDFSAEGSFLNCGYLADRQSVLSLDPSLRNAVTKLGWYSQNCARVLDLLPNIDTIFSDFDSCRCFCGNVLFQGQCTAW